VWNCGYRQQRDYLLFYKPFDKEKFAKVNTASIGIFSFSRGCLESIGVDRGEQGGGGVVSSGFLYTIPRMFIQQSLVLRKHPNSHQPSS